MKKIIILILLAVIVSSLVLTVGKAQSPHLQTSGGLGFNFKSIPVYNVGLGVNYGRLNLDLLVNNECSRDSQSNHYTGFKFSINLFNEDEVNLTNIKILPHIDYYKDHVKAAIFKDKKESPNKYYPGAGIKLILLQRREIGDEISNDNGFYMDFLYINKQAQVTVGFYINKLFNL